MNTVEHIAAKAAEPEKLSYYWFDQNNSGGGFVVDDKVAHNVIIQAHNAGEACDKALNIGIYFDGCETGEDCSCCGDRWHEPWQDGTDTPKIYDTAPINYRETFCSVGQIYCYVYHYDGSVDVYRKGEIK